jgi:hypothetical protein
MSGGGSMDKSNLKGCIMQTNSHNQAIPEAVITAETAINAQLEVLAAYEQLKAAYLNKGRKRRENEDE